jgi:hypothetical protein
MQVVGAWLKTLRDDARIEVNPALLAQGGTPPQP